MIRNGERRDRAVTRDTRPTIALPQRGNLEREIEWKGGHIAQESRRDSAAPCWPWRSLVSIYRVVVRGVLREEEQPTRPRRSLCARACARV